MWKWVRYRALILAVLPFILGASLWILSEDAEGWDGLAYLVALILVMPVLAGMAALSVMFAFRKGDNLRQLPRTSMFASVFSLTVFGGLVLMGLAGVIQTLVA